MSRPSLMGGRRRSAYILTADAGCLFGCRGLRDDQREYMRPLNLRRLVPQAPPHPPTAPSSRWCADLGVVEGCRPGGGGAGGVRRLPGLPVHLTQSGLVRPGSRGCGSRVRPVNMTLRAFPVRRRGGACAYVDLPAIALSPPPREHFCLVLASFHMHRR